METKINEVEINGVAYVEKGSNINPPDDDELEINIASIPDFSVVPNYVIVRTTSAGVFAGELVLREGKEVTLKDARRLWYWKGAASLSQLAMEGVKNPDECKFPCEVTTITLTEVIEIIHCTAKAVASIKGVPVWEK